MQAFIYGGIALCAGVLLLAPFTCAKDKTNDDPEIVASQGEHDANFKKIDETSGIAIAGFPDENGHQLLWAHNENTSQITLITTVPANTLYVGALTMPGKKTRDAEDIAIVHDQGKGTIYLEDAGANRNDMPACVRYAHKKENPSECSVLDSIVSHINKKSASERQTGKEECLAWGDDWIWMDETDYLAPGIHPAIRRIPEPTYAEVIREKLMVNTEIIEFEYPRLCGDKPCHELAGNKISDIAQAYNIESLAVVVEPDHSHTAYLFTKAPLSLALRLKKQHPDAAYCKFDSDGISDVFRIRHIDSLSPKELHQAEYVTTLDFTEYDGAANNNRSYRATAANFLRLSGSQGLLLVRTNGSAYKWPVSLTTDKGMNSNAVFDIADALKHIKPLLAAVPSKNKMQGVGKKNQEAATQLDESTIYYMGECKGLPVCSVTMVRDNHLFLAGDIDGNGRIDADDIKYLKKFLSGETSLYCQAAADVNGDNRITDADQQYLQQYVEGHGPAPVQRGRQAGDTTVLSCGYYAFRSQK